MIRKFENCIPEVDKSCFISDSADVIGKVHLCKDVNVWFGAVIRGDLNSIYIGEKTNIQDNCVVHVEHPNPTHIGNYVTIGHSAIIHGCEIGDCTLIGMGSIIMNGAVIGSETIIGAGSIVTQNKNIPSGVLCLGSPAKVIRKLTDKEKVNLKKEAQKYIDNSKKYGEYNINK